MSAEECRANAERCEQMAGSLGPDNAELQETMREVAAQWRQLAAYAEARRLDPLLKLIRKQPARYRANQ
jgi:hypothetical protein